MIEKGDTVRVVKPYEGWLKVGEEYVVELGQEVTNSTINIIHPTRGLGGFEVNHFEKVEPVTESTTTTTVDGITLTDGTYGQLQVIQGKVLRYKKLAVLVFGGTLLIDVSARNSTSVESHLLLDSITKQANDANLPIRYVTDLAQFFDGKARWKQFMETGETSGVEVSDEEKEALKTATALKERFIAAFKLPEAPKLPYVKLANTGNPLRDYTITKARISNSIGYGLSLSTAEKLWNQAREDWRAVGGEAKTNRLNSYGRVRASGYNSEVRVYGDRIEIGCQTIRRAAVEALAVKQGWSFD